MEPHEAAWQRQAALDHATKLVTLILHGDPHIEEPLAIAWDRALDRLGLSDVPQEVLSYRLRAVVAALPGDTENAKIARVFSSAPSWLLYYASLDCFLLGIELPKSSEPVPEYGLDGLRDSWPNLPTGTIGAGPPLPKPNPWFVLSHEEGMDWDRLCNVGEENWLRRDRHRFSELRAKMDKWVAKLAASD
jgi:hypothetical protein